MTTLAQVVWEASLRRYLDGDLRDGKKLAVGRYGDREFQEEVIASAKALRQRRDEYARGRERRKVYQGLKGRQGAIERNSKREMRKALKT